jgi:peptidyl-prolyl cis-trans isomerase C
MRHFSARPFALAACLATFAGSALAEDPARVVASVNGTDITLGHVVVMFDQLPEQYKTLPDDVLFTGILEQLIQQTALAQTIEGKIDRRDEMILESERRAYLATKALRLVAGDAVTDAALEAAYAERFANAVPKTEYNAAHILVETEEQATELLAQLHAGADFATLAREHSSDGAAQNGGSLGWFGLGMMVKPFEDAVVAMTPGEYAGPLQTQFGWHLIHLIETREAAVPTLEEMRDELAQELENAAIDQQIKSVTDAATVIRASDGIDPAILRDTTLFDN